MKSVLLTAALICYGLLAGCNNAKLTDLGREKFALTVDFRKDENLRYKFVSSRDIDIILGDSSSKTGPSRKASDKSTEKMEMVVVYTPIDVDSYGLTTIKATCESVRVNRSQRSRPAKDAVEYLPGQSFTFPVGPTGRIEDYSQLDNLIKEIGTKAFRSSSKQARTKEPDMICDFVATQWFLWDSVSSANQGSKGLSVGQVWQSKLSIPTPMVTRLARDVTYKIEEIRQSQDDQLAVIQSTYSHAESVPQSWPIPYMGSFMMAGPFGFYRNYKVLELKGQGRELFNIDKGRTEQYTQEYEMSLSASMPFNLGGVEPRIIIQQKLTMELLAE